MIAAPRRVVLLSGGVGGSKLAEGLLHVLPPAALTVIANTGDDIELFGLRISPDLDILTYTLGGRVNRQAGWGLEDESWQALESIRQLGGADWFNLGDRDLGVHLYRTGRLRSGAGLAQVTGEIARGFGVACRILPMCEAPVPTRIVTDEGELHVQEYLVRRRCEPVVRGIRCEGIDNAAAGPGVLDAIEQCDTVLFAPSNPLISIGPILAVPGVRAALQSARAPKIAVSPIVGGKSLKGPADKMLRQLGHRVSAAGVAALYKGLIDRMVIDTVDSSETAEIEAMGIPASAMPTVMDDLESRKRLARNLLALAG